MLFIMWQNLFKASKYNKKAEAKSENANDLPRFQHMHLKSAGNTLIKGPVQYQRLSRNEH